MKSDYIMTAEEITATVADAHKRLDAGLTEAREAALDIERATENWIATQSFPSLKAKKALHMARSLTGAIAAAGEKSAEAHIFHHAVAKEANIDTPALNVVGGVMPMGGTR